MNFSENLETRKSVMMDEKDLENGTEKRDTGKAE